MGDLSAEMVELEPQEAIAVRGDVALADLPAFFERAFHDAAQAAATAGAEIVGPPFGFYPETPTATVAVEAGFPVSARSSGSAGSAGSEAGDGTHRLVLPGGRAVQATHVGPYETLEQTYDELQSWMAERGLEPSAGMWESYLSDPQAEPDPATWRTIITWPVA
jgi:effector-binding domain-containing protein